jgi:RNA polymerase sigma factor (TIGR02999 family)
MTTDPPVTELLQQVRAGDRSAFAKLWPVVYEELRTLASRLLHAERPGHTLQPTALVHEAYLRLVDERAGWQDRAHFFAIAAQAMRRILVDYARGHLASKRGGSLRRVSLDGSLAAPAAADVSLDDVIEVDEALGELAALDAFEARVVELRYFGGLTVEETAAALGVSPATVKREWQMARAWLYRRLSGGHDGDR